MGPIKITLAISIIIIILLVAWISHLRHILAEADKTRIEMHDAFYAQWANAVGYRDILLQQCNVTINQTEPFEVYHSGNNQ